VLTNSTGTEHKDKVPSTENQYEVLLTFTRERTMSLGWENKTSFKIQEVSPHEREHKPFIPCYFKIFSLRGIEMKRFIVITHYGICCEKEEIFQLVYIHEHF
jgi:hypothetical protein